VTPLGVLAIIGALVSVAGYRRRRVRRRRVHAQFALTLASWALLWFAAASSFAKEGMTNLPIHMIGHVIVMFLVPIGLILSGAGRGIMWALPVAFRRRVMRWFYVRRSWRTPTWLVSPVSGFLALNVVMVAAHTAPVFDWVMAANWRMDWLMEPAFLLSGLLFFHFIISAPPRQNRVKLRWQLAMVALTMLEMLIMAMAMSIFTKAPWYSVMLPGSAMAMPGMAMPGLATSASQAFHQQQLAAAILWICGDFWAVPCVVLIIRRLIQRDGGFLAALERQSSFSTSD